MNYTKGKWEAIDTYSGPVIESKEWQIAHVLRYTNMPKGIVESNARLIAAAPDMYEALNESQIYLKTMLSLHPTDSILLVLLQQNKKALAKAGGK